MFIEWLAKIWSVNDQLPLTARLIVPVAHGATENRATYGAVEVASVTKKISVMYDSVPFWVPKMTILRCG